MGRYFLFFILLVTVLVFISLGSIDPAAIIFDTADLLNLMDLVKTIFLSILQGVTEFLPVSSSAHLIIVPILLEWEEQGLAFDIAVHIGTLLAVLIYYRKLLWNMTKDWVVSCLSQEQTKYSLLAWYVLLATIPLGLVGLLGKDFIEEHLRGELVIAFTTIFYAFILWWADSVNKSKKEFREVNLKLAMLIGLSQALALIPGTSRAGITISMALFLGIERKNALHFSFLLSIPAIFLPGMLLVKDVIMQPQEIEILMLGLAISISFITAITSMHLFLRLVNNIGFLPFVIYRIFLGLVLLALFL